jgi:Arc/MetJ-type ribon-helix-helix transcriptional regulator
MLRTVRSELESSRRRSRSEVVREAIERHLAADRELEIDRLVVEAYTRQPPEDVRNDEAAKRMISAEPW